MAASVILFPKPPQCSPSNSKLTGPYSSGEDSMWLGPALLFSFNIMNLLRTHKILVSLGIAVNKKAQTPAFIELRPARWTEIH